MGGGHSRGWKPTPINIPGFNYPSNIFDYLKSQSGGYKITFTTPQNTNYDISTAGDMEFAPEDEEATIEDTTAATTTTPVPTTAPAFSTTLAPTTLAGSQSIATTIPTTPLPTPTPMKLPGNIPLIWVSAIRSMEFVQYTLQPPLTTIDQLKLLYSTLATEMKAYIDKETGKGDGNLAAAIYFCTVITLSFSHFPPAIPSANENNCDGGLSTYFLYNKLHGVNSPFHTIFANQKNYYTIIMLNYYSILLSYIFNKWDFTSDTTKFGITKFKPLTGNHYIPMTDKLMIYMMNPTIFSNILQILNTANPTSDDS